MNIYDPVSGESGTFTRDGERDGPQNNASLLYDDYDAGYEKNILPN